MIGAEDLTLLQQLKESAEIILAVAGLSTAYIAFSQFRKSRSEREQMKELASAFAAVVTALASESEVERLAAAVRIRRFFDKKTELGAADTAYADEALKVITALLRGHPSGTLQKLLADGLAFAPSLRHADLTSANLQDAYLGAKQQDDHSNGRTPDLSGADLYRANLTNASLKGAVARKTQFYQAALVRTVFKGADLSNANFYEADLTGARFEGAFLEDASFFGAMNVPAQISEWIDEETGRYEGPERVPKAKKDPRSAPPKVFISRPGIMTLDQRTAVAALTAAIREQGIETVELPREEYSPSGPIAEVRRRLMDCAGIVVIGLPEFEVIEGRWRPNTEEEREHVSTCLPTPWAQIEAGMAAMSGMPILLARDARVDYGLFAGDSNEPSMFTVDLRADLSRSSYQSVFGEWCAMVGVHAAPLRSKASS